MANLIVNGDCETGSGTDSGLNTYVGGTINYRVYRSDMGGTVSLQTTIKHLGNQAIKSDLGGADAWNNTLYVAPADFASAVPVSPSTHYYFRGYLKAVGVVPAVQNPSIYIYEMNSAGSYIAGTDVTLPLASGDQDWTEILRDWITNVNAAYVQFHWARCHGHGGSIYSDDFYLDTVPPSIKVLKSGIFVFDKKMFTPKSGLFGFDKFVFAPKNGLFNFDKLIPASKQELLVFDKVAFALSNKISVLDKLVFAQKNSSLVSDKSAFITKASLFVSDKFVYVGKVLTSVFDKSSTILKNALAVLSKSISYFLKYTPQGTAYGEKYSPRGTTYGDKFTKQNNSYKDKYEKGVF